MRFALLVVVTCVSHCLRLHGYGILISESLALGRITIINFAVCIVLDF